MLMLIGCVALFACDSDDSYESTEEESTTELLGEWSYNDGASTLLFESDVCDFDGTEYTYSFITPDIILYYDSEISAYGTLSDDETSITLWYASDEDTTYEYTKVEEDDDEEENDEEEDEEEENESEEESDEE